MADDKQDQYNNQKGLPKKTKEAITKAQRANARQKKVDNSKTKKGGKG